jgi:integrase
MANQRITDRMLDGKPKSSRDEIWDSVVPGFGYRKSAVGKAAFFISFRDGADKKRRHSIGKYPAMTLAEARELATETIKKAARGEAINVQAKKIDTSFATLLERYLTEYVEQRLRTAIQLRRALTKYALPLFNSRPVERITSEDIHNLLHSITAPYQANRIHAHLSGFFRWCQTQPSIPVVINPVKSVLKPNVEVSRDRELNREEVQVVLTACREMDNVFGKLYEILIRTGLRKSEIGKLTWDRLDLDEETLELKAGNTKNAKPVVVPLTPVVLSLFQSIKQNGPYVFTTNGKTSVSGFSKTEKKLREMTGVQDFRVHDFRRTFASTLARLKVPPHIIESCLNHVSGKISGVAAVYNRYQYFDERRDALLRLEGHLADNVVAFDKDGTS